LNQKINHIDFFEKLLKTGELLKQEKIWNIFKNFSQGKDYIEDRNLVKNYLIEKEYKIPEFEKIFPQNQPIKYYSLLEYFNANNIIK